MKSNRINSAQQAEKRKKRFTIQHKIFTVFFCCRQKWRRQKNKMYQSNKNASRWQTA